MSNRRAQGYTIPLPRPAPLGLPAQEPFPRPPPTRYTLRPKLDWDTPPDTWEHSLAEWVVYWYLTAGREGYSGLPNLRRVGPDVEPERGATFFFQIEVPNLGLFASEVTRVDFFLPGFGSVGYEALAIDPRNDWTHPDPLLDLLKRQTLAVQAGVQLVWIDTGRLEGGDLGVIEAALRGEDESSLALFGA